MKEATPLSRVKEIVIRNTEQKIGNKAFRRLMKAYKKFMQFEEK